MYGQQDEFLVSKFQSELCLGMYLYCYIYFFSNLCIIFEHKIHIQFGIFCCFRLLYQALHIQHLASLYFYERRLISLEGTSAMSTEWQFHILTTSIERRDPWTISIRSNLGHANTIWNPKFIHISMNISYLKNI